MKKLNFGCGSIQPNSWINVDSDPSFHTIESTKIFEDNSFDIIVAHAVVQQFEWHSIVENLCELKRILKPGGVLRISLPDIVAGFYAYIVKNKKFFPNNERDIDDRFSAWLTWYSTSKSLLTQQALITKLIEAGFPSLGIEKVEFKKTFKNGFSVELDTRESEFFFVEATK